MKSTLQENPFPVNVYRGADYFCDRQEETKHLISNISNGLATTIIAIRRIGKTGLIHHTLSKLPKSITGVYVDILETEDMNAFLNHLASSILSAFPEKGRIGSRFWNFIKSLRPTISFDAFTGAPQASFRIEQKETESNIEAILHFLEKQHTKTVIAIDEFQQITKYPQSNMDAWLRARIQGLKNVVFIFSGSQQHLMTELFTLPQRPFYRSTQIMKLEKLHKDSYCDFIVQMFKKGNKIISETIAKDIIDWTETYTYYTQLLCNKVFSNSQGLVTDDDWKREAMLLIREQESMFFIQRNMLTPPQWKLLMAIASEGIVMHVTAKEFLIKYKLGSSATTLRSLKTLLKYELIFKEYTQEGNPYYSIYDLFMKKWAKMILR